MGQAKRRGSFEERQKQAIERQEEFFRILADKERRNQAAEDAHLATLSEKEKDSFYSRRVLLAAALLFGPHA